MSESSYKLRRVTLNDCDKVWEIRNKQEVRETSLNTEFIELESHRQWFANNIQSPVSQLLVMEENGIICGVIRFDLQSTAAEISLYLDPPYFGKGLGKLLLSEGVKWLKSFEPNVKVMTARIRPENLRSQKLFGKMGFAKEHNIWVRRI